MKLRDLGEFAFIERIRKQAARSPELALGDALKFMDATAREILPPGYTTDLNGQSREFRSSSGSLALVFVLALVFIYLVLAAQFESFVDPLVIMLSVPLSMLGALLALKFSGGTLNVFSQIGLITLVGLITKHGILIVEFANQLQHEEGLNKRDAVIEASAIRLRPIVMTSVALIVAMVPLLIATGAGAVSRFDIGLTIASGLGIGTLFTLFVLPAFYLLLARDHNAAKDAGAEATTTS